MYTYYLVMLDIIVTKYCNSHIHTPLPLLRTSQTWLNMQWTVTHGHPVITRCPWVTAVGTGMTQCWLQAVSRCYLSIYCLYQECLSLHVASCKLFSLKFYHYFCHQVPYTTTCCGRPHSLKHRPPCPLLSALGHTDLLRRADVLYGWLLKFLFKVCRNWEV